MNIDRNPFFLRASEHIESDDIFLKLFSPEILRVLDADKIWNTVNIIRSSPGGGKTTLLKLFTPSVLNTIISLKQHDFKELFKLLTDLKVFKGNNINIAGSLLSFTSEYSSLKEIDVSEVLRNRLFYALLNSRITLSILKSLNDCNKDFEFPNDLDKIQINFSDPVYTTTGVPIKGTGFDYYQWACKLEEEICDELDSVLTINKSSLKGHEELFAFKIFNPGNITINGKQVVEKILVMLDDIHNLSKEQREILLNNIINIRPLVNVWLSERLEALSTPELFSYGKKEERDYTLINLEEFWRSGKNFEKFSKSVGDKRLQAASEGHLTSFDGCLQNTIEDKDVDKIIQRVEYKIKDNYGKTETYKNWLKAKENFNGSNFEKLVGWRSLEILLNRNRNKQQSFFPNLDEEELNEQEGSDVKNAAKLFLNREFNIPYYFSFPTVSKLSTNNIEQFLEISGELFEEIISESLTKLIKKQNKALSVFPKRQEEIIKKISERSWQGLKTRIPEFDKIEKFLDGIGRFCIEETYQPNAPISPGVNGIAITMQDRDSLIKYFNENKKPYNKLAQYLSICVAFNLLESRLNYKCKGKEWMVLYLNKLYCVKYRLPLEYGGFREKKLRDLLDWLEIGFIPKKDLWTIQEDGKTIS